MDKKILIGRTLGSIGMCFPITANFLPPSTLRNSFFVIGSILMLIAALLERELFFTMLQLIILIGASMAFVPWSLLARAAVPIALTIIILIFFALTKRLQDKLTLFGSVGMATLALGYAITNPFIYLCGGALLAIYASIAFYRGVTIALLWAILNTVFTFAAAYSIYQFIFST